MKGCENQIVEYCSKDFNQGKDNTTLICDNGWKVNGRDITRKYFFDLRDDKITLSQINEQDPRFYKYHQKALLTLFYCSRERKQRPKPEVIWYRFW
jgi:hypothetical protein